KDYCIAMSQSQFSDFTSSFYGENDDSQILNSSASQLTQDPWEPNFLRPNAPLPIPPSLTCVGPDRQKSFVLYNTMVHSEWVDWWLETEYGAKSKIKWDSQRHTAIWDNYHQVAHITNGAPKVMCKRCSKVLEHPYTPSACGEKINYHGTSTMQKHLKTAACLRSVNKSSKITTFLQPEVCFIIYLLLYINTYLLSPLF
ncbi:unnamed protein product, partial [Penicillium salamii]